MISLNAKIRKETGKKTDALREANRIPAVVYGHKVKNLPLDIDYKDFQKVLREAGESSLIELSVSAPAKVEEDLAKEIEEKVEDVEKVEKEKKAEDIVEETAEEKND